jgi:hypothetical protein
MLIPAHTVVGFGRREGHIAQRWPHLIHEVMGTKGKGQDREQQRV